MSLLTNWGYTLTDVNVLPALVSINDFQIMTSGKYACDSRVSSVLSAAQSAVRNYVGWHLGNSQNCEAEFNIISPAAVYVGGDIMITLPAKYVSDVSAVIVNAVKSDGEWTGTTWSDFVFEVNGVLRLFNVGGLDRRAKIVVRYTAGLPEKLLESIGEMCVSRTVHGLNQSNGIQSETAGGVSITYNSTYANGAKAFSLTEADKEALAPYKLQGVY